jgi:tricorn protease interacting factor F2/3
VQVVDYNLLLNIDFDGLKFKGRLLIKLNSEQDVVLNSVGLDVSNVSSGKRSFSFRQDGEDLIVETGPFDGTLQVDYAGSIPDLLAGIYRAPYDHNHIITTHFEPAQARRMFPCVDRPDVKANFKLTLIIPKDLDAISNMPIKSVDVAGSTKTVAFRETPRMSTYLLYLGVGKFEEQTATLAKTDVILATTPGKSKLGTFALDEAEKALQFYEGYYGMPYQLPKLHLIAVPEFAVGAMENWGAITFREVALLQDASSSTRSRKRVSETVAHEIAHQWFGDLVTMKWWDDIWLNESFATFMAFKVLDSIHGEWRPWEDFLLEETAGAMARDCLKNSHPIEVPVRSPDEIEQVFDAISYGKGASILRMIEAYIGKDAFEDGIRRYLSAHVYGNATGNDLWTTLEEVSGRQVQKIMAGWIRQPGFPIVTVQLSEGKLILRQARFILTGSSEGALWPIPITLELNGQTRSLLMEKESIILDVKDVKSLRINIDRTGFYVVHYEDLEKLVWGSDLSAVDRWGIVSDAFSFLLSGRINFTHYTSILQKFAREQDYLPAYEVSNQLSILYTILPAQITEIAKTFHRLQLEILGAKHDENSRILRGLMASRLTLVDDTYAAEMATKFNELEKVEPDMKQAVVLAYARSTSDYETLLKGYGESASDETRVRFLNAMTAFRSESLIRRALEFALSGEVKRQDVRTVILAAAEKPEAKNVTWAWLQSNVEKLRSLYQDTGILSGTFLSLIPILGIGRIIEFEEYFNQHKMPEADVGIKAGLEKLRAYDRLVRNITRK